MAKTAQRVVSFFLAFFLFASSIAAVVLVIKQSNDQQAASDAASAQQLGQKQCQKPAQFEAPRPPSSPGNIQPVSGKVSELQSTDIKVGTGDAAQLDDCITVSYRLYLADGTPVVGNDTFATGEAIAFQLKEGSLIKGWIDGIPGMKVGGIRHLIIPASLAYGEQGSCQTADPADQTKCSVYAIAPNADLVFDIELLDTQR